MSKEVKVSFSRRKRAVDTTTRIAKEFEVLLDKYGDWQNCINEPDLSP
ncbi:MAG: hypothetical protein ACYCVD_09495 [Desulfitobacteriaceae bacterium]